jgi:hypothetical protein
MNWWRGCAAIGRAAVLRPPTAEGAICDIRRGSVMVGLPRSGDDYAQRIAEGSCR